MQDESEDRRLRSHGRAGNQSSVHTVHTLGMWGQGHMRVPSDPWEGSLLLTPVFHALALEEFIDSAGQKRNAKKRNEK